MYYRYVDDIVLSGPDEVLNSTLDELNSFHENLKLTILTINYFNY